LEEKRFKKFLTPPFLTKGGVFYLFCEYFLQDGQNLLANLLLRGKTL